MKAGLDFFSQKAFANQVKIRIFADINCFASMNAQISMLLPKIREYFKDKPVLRAWLFGSCSRGEETQTSDIDILVDYDHTNHRVSLLKMGGMLMDLSELLGRRVDLVDNRGLMDFARRSVDNDKILIYERAIER